MFLRSARMQLFHRLLAFFSLPLFALAAAADTGSPKAVLPVPAGYTDPSSAGTLARHSSSPIGLKGGSQLTIIAPGRWTAVAKNFSDILRETHSYYTDLFASIPPFSVSLRIMPGDIFYRVTGAPDWTNAMFYRGQILLPIDEHIAADFDGVSRSLRHEYTHAVVHALSGGRCPGWIDEGLAQWAEGKENPALKPALQNWLMQNQAVPLALLQNGFTRLDAAMVPAAYAQALFATRAIIDNYGFEKIGRYLSKLREGSNSPVAFLAAFQISEPDFEAQMRRTLDRWAARTRRVPEKRPRAPNTGQVLSTAAAVVRAGRRITP